MLLQEMIQDMEENDEINDLNEYFSQMLELYTMLPPREFLCMHRKSNSTDNNSGVKNQVTEEGRQESPVFQTK